MIVKLLTEHHLEFLSLKGGCGGSSEPTHVKTPHCWKSHATAHFILIIRTVAFFLQKIMINSWYTEKNNYFFLYNYM